MILRWKQYIHITIERGAVVNRVKFILGEDKHIELLIRSPNNEPFTIISASYDLRRYGEVEACLIAFWYFFNGTLIATAGFKVIFVPEIIIPFCMMTIEYFSHCKE